MACLLLIACAAHAQDAPPKKRVAVLNFDSPSGSFGMAEDVGRGVSVQLIQKLVEGGKYTVVDRSALERLLKQQSEADRDAVDAYGLAAKIGRILGLDAMIIGAVTRYGPDDKDKAAIPPHSGMHTRQAKASVEITARIFNVTTGQVADAFTCTGISEHTGSITTIAGHGKSMPPAEMLGSEFLGSLFNEATRSAIDQLAAQLNASAEKIPVLHQNEQGVVADVDKNTLTLTIGKIAGVKVGDQFEILRPANQPAGTSAPTAPPSTNLIGSATVTEVSDDYSIAQFAGATPAQVGDSLRPKKRDN